MSQKHDIQLKWVYLLSTGKGFLSSSLSAPFIEHEVLNVIQCWNHKQLTKPAVQVTKKCDYSAKAYSIYKKNLLNFLNKLILKFDVKLSCNQW